MKVNIVVYKSLRKNFDVTGLFDKHNLEQIEAGFLTNPAGTVTVQNGIIECDAQSSNAACFRHRIPIGSVPQIDANNFFGDVYQIDFDFRLKVVDSSKTSVFTLTSDQLNFIDAVTDNALTNLNANIKFEFYVYTSPIVTVLRVKTEAGANSDFALAPPGTLIINTWYSCRVKRERDRYNFEIFDSLGNQLISEDLTFDDFDGSNDLRFSNEDDTHGETADFGIWGIPNVSSATEGKIEYDDIYISTPIEFIGYDVINIDVSNSVNNDMPYLNFKLNNAEYISILEQIRLKYNDQLEDEDRIVLYMGKEVDAIV